MRQDIAAILGRVRLRYLHHLFMRWVHNGFERAIWPWPLQIACAAKCCGGMADIDCRLLSLAGFQLPNIVDRNTNTAKHSSCRFANFEARGYDWISACDGHLVSGRLSQAASGYDFIECGGHRGRSFMQGNLGVLLLAFCCFASAAIDSFQWRIQDSTWAMNASGAAGRV